VRVTCIICGGNDFRKAFSKQGYDFVRCPTCRVMRLDPIPSLEELREHYEARTAHGNYEMDVSRGRDQSIADTLDFIVRQTGPRPGLKLLDIGCFDGKLMDLANDRLRWDCWGVELNEKAVEVAKQRHGERVCCSSIEDYDPPPGSKFDVISAIAVIEHLREPGLLLAKIASWLAQDGKCILELPNAASWPARLLGRYWPPIAAPEHIWYLGPSHIANLAHDVGLKCIGREPHWKNLSIAHIYHQLQFFGPEMRKIVGIIIRPLPSGAQQTRLNIYVGEMHVVLCRR
jgi:2-polyprenyl-3-methyl-5-hydroxy-6-metoxy-1,4-benzoquinol methylase